MPQRCGPASPRSSLQQSTSLLITEAEQTLFTYVNELRALGAFEGEDLDSTRLSVRAPCPSIVKGKVMMKNAAKILLGVSFLGIAACDVDQTKEGKLPDVDVNTSGGQLPEFNVEGPEVNVGTENKTIEVPTVDVNLPDEGKEEKKE